MEKAQARQYRDRWQAVEDVRQKDAGWAAFEGRWRRLNAAFGIGRGLNLGSSQSGEIRVYQRWAKLKQILSPSRKA